ncbi:MAG: 2-C-methyl-D-erythritol 4-phosphate cytidylyltransferase [Coriobacteriales bacterium]|jgi:2-C-methyl-D-erythritol 4-phosphate cytidylyltransferase
MIYAGILAGGKGKRMGHTERPKQFLKLADGTPIIIHTLQAFLACEEISQIVIASPEAWREYTEVVVNENCSAEEVERIHIISGGKERSDSLENICDYIDSTWGLRDDDVLVSHDAVRPFVTERIIRENIEYTKKYGCVDTVVPATDTIVVSEGGETIDSIPPRAQFYQGQTPQSFFIKEYLDAFASLTAEQRRTLTDACKVYVFHGKQVYLVMGEYSNIKITTPHDIHVATSILMQGSGS